MSTIQSQRPGTAEDAPQPGSKQQKLFIAAGLLVLLVIALVMRLHTLGLPFDLDSYDEGVYWQTLRSLSAGHALYTSTFYSQPPMFVLSIFPAYQLLGQTFWAARIGIVLISLLGLVGAFILGYILQGRVGAFAALLLLICNQNYLHASQTIQAEGPQVAYTLLAIAFAYLWWTYPNGWRGSLYAALCTLTLALSSFSKLFGVFTIIPIGLLALAYIWRVARQPAHTRLAALRSLFIGLLVFILACVVIMLPEINTLPQFWSSVIGFHTAGQTDVARTQNTVILKQFLLSPLGFAALIGTIIAFYRRNWHVIPLLIWFLFTTLWLWKEQLPLFTHHLVILVPSMIALTILGLGSLSLSDLNIMRKQPRRLSALITGLSLLVILISGLVGIWSIRTYYHQNEANGTSPATKRSLQVASDIDQVVQPQSYVITDGQFVVGLAGRSTPPQLVDTSSVRKETGSLTEQQMIQYASEPQVQAILFYTGRLTQFSTFHSWVAQHYQLVHNYGKGSELWVKIR